MRKILAIAAIGLMALVGCDTDRGANKDLPNQQQELDEGSAQIYLFPDGYPNVAHKCDETTQTGIWTVTDRHVWIYYNDPACGGDGSGPIIDNIPGAKQAP